MNFSSDDSLVLQFYSGLLCSSSAVGVFTLFLLVPSMVAGLTPKFAWGVPGCPLEKKGSNLGSLYLTVWRAEKHRALLMLQMQAHQCPDCRAGSWILQGFAAAEGGQYQSQDAGCGVEAGVTQEFIAVSVLVDCMTQLIVRAHILRL